jgi:5-formyltetrahydrofolate cyclo-ligase
MSGTAADIRRRMRVARRKVPPQECERVARIVARKLGALDLLRHGERVGIYAPMRGEIPTGALVRLASERGCLLYLPRITSERARRMTFAPMRGPWRRSSYGILEPTRLAGSLSARWMDILIVPLVAFDAAGTRIGGGTGYYDRALGHLRLRHSWRKPKTVGVAFDLQRVPAIGRQPWDVPLDLIVTERHVYHGRR